MNPDTPIQNTDIVNDNPLRTNFDATDPTTDSTSTAPAKTKKPQDPKIKLLIGLGIVIALLLPISLIVPNKNKPTVSVTPTPTPLAVQEGPSPAINPEQIPPSLQTQFDNISKLINPPDLISAPQIDDTTGKQ